MHVGLKTPPLYLEQHHPFFRSADLHVVLVMKLVTKGTWFHPRLDGTNFFKGTDALLGWGTITQGLTSRSRKPNGIRLEAGYVHQRAPLCASINARDGKNTTAVPYPQPMDTNTLQLQPRRRTGVKQSSRQGHTFWLRNVGSVWYCIDPTTHDPAGLRI